MTRISAFTVTRSAQQAPEPERGEGWLRSAVCAQVDPGVFEPDNDHTPTESEWEVPRAICRTCPVVEACLADVMSVEAPGARYGMCGAMNPEERRRYGRRLSRLGVAS